MFLGNTASEIFIPRHFLFALPLSKVCAMRSALCLSRLCRCSRLRRPALSLSLCGVVCKFVKSFLFVVLTLPHQRPPNAVHFSRNLYADPKKNQLTIWTFSTCCTIWVGQTCRQNKSKQTKHMNNRSKSYSQSKSQSLQLHASCQFDFDFDYLNLHWPLGSCSNQDGQKGQSQLVLASTPNALSLATIYILAKVLGGREESAGSVWLSGCSKCPACCVGLDKIYANETKTTCHSVRALTLAKVQLRRQEIYEPSTPNVFTLCHPSVSLIYLFADSQQKANKPRRLK